MRRIAVLVSALALGSGLVAGVPVSAAVPPGVEPATAVSASEAPGRGVRGAIPQPRALGTVVTAGKFVYDKVSTCLSNQEVGLKCTSGDGGNIRAIYKKLGEIEAQMATNQRVLVERFGSLERLIEQVNIKLDKKQLVAIEKHLPLSLWALEALTECAQAYSKALPAAPTPSDIERAKKSAQCQPYIGRPGGAREPLKNVVAATGETQDYFLREVDKMSQFGSLEVMSAYFAGTAPNHRDGMAWAIWLHEVGEQNRGSGATAKANGIPQGMTPVVTKSLSKKVNAAMAYWDQTFNTYGMLKVVAAGLKKGPEMANQRQIAVDREITCTKSQCEPGTVGDIAKRFRLPELKSGQFLFVETDQGGLWKISADSSLKGSGNSGDLTINTVLQMSRSVNKYATMSGLFKYDEKSFAKAGPLPNRPTYGTRVGYSSTMYAVCIKNLCIQSNDPQTTGFQPIQTGVKVDQSCWTEVNVEDKRPDWNANYYDPNTYTVPRRDFWKTGKEIYNQEIWAPVSMPWTTYEVRDKNGFKSGEWGWGMRARCIESAPQASMRFLGDVTKKPANINPYLGWK